MTKHYSPLSARWLRIAAAALLFVAVSASAQTRRGAKPDLSGIWQALGNANWDLEAHEAEAGPVPSLGTLLAVPPGPGVVVGG